MSGSWPQRKDKETYTSLQNHGTFIVVNAEIGSWEDRRVSLPAAALERDWGRLVTVLKNEWSL